MPDDDDLTPNSGYDPAGDAIRRRLVGAAEPADPTGAYERVVEKKVSRRVRRRIGTVALAVLVVAGTAGGTLALTQVFRKGQPAAVGSPNGRIAFTMRGEDGVTRIWTSNPDGSAIRVLTPRALEASDPAWSPDGTMIAFRGWPATARRSTSPDQSLPMTVAISHVYVMNGDGSALRDLTPSAEPGKDVYQNPVWAGRDSIYFDEFRDGGPIFTIDVQTRQIDQFARTPGWYPFDLSSSLDGRLAVVLTSPHKPNVLRIFDPDGSLGSPLTVVGATLSAWSPDGTTVAFGKIDAGRSEIDTIHVSGSGLVIVARGIEPSRLSYSPNGSRILISGRKGVFAVKATGGSPRPVPLPGGASDASWQPVPGTVVSPSPTTTPTTPSESPTPSATPTPTPSPTGTCPTTSVTADFDGDGVQDHAKVGPTPCIDESPPQTEYSIQVVFSSGAQGIWPLPECSDASCAGVGSIPMNDGSNALVLRTHEGASTVFYELLNLLPSEAGPQEYGVVDPGAPGFPAGQTAVFPDQGSITHQAFFRCQGGPYPGGGDQATIVETTATLSQDQSTYAVVETILAHGPNTGKPELIVVAQTSKDVALDAFDPAKDVTGVPCWGEGSGSPSP